MVLTAGALFLYSGLRASLNDAVTAELRVRADDVAAQIESGSPAVLAGGLLTQILTGQGDILAPAGHYPIIDAGEVRRSGPQTVIDRPVPEIGRAARVLVRPVTLPGGDPGLVVVAGSTAPIRRAEARLGVVLGVAGPAMVVGVAALAWVLTGAALRPVARMTRRAATLSLRDADARLPQTTGRDEIAELGRTLNQMLDRISETVAHERAFVDNASHDLRTPLAVLRGELELARMDLTEGIEPERIAGAVDSAIEETDRLVTLTQHLLTLARADAGVLVGQSEAVALAAAARSVLRRVQVPEVRFEVGIDDDLVVVADPLALDQLLANLAANAGRWAHARVLVEAALGSDGVAIRVADDGPGFPPDLIGRAFDRFTTAEPARQRSGSGTGLGLAIVAAIVAALGGRVEARNGPPLGGACVEVRLPPERVARG